MVDRVDDDDRVIGQVRRSDAYALKANFRVVHVFVINGSGQLLIHQLSSTKRRFPGFWGSSVAGGVKAGETPSNAARREVREELGIDVKDIRQIGRTVVEEEGLKKFLYLFGATHDGPVHADPQEVAAVDFVDVSRIRAMIRAQERPFTPTFVAAWELFDAPAEA